MGEIGVGGAGGWRAAKGDLCRGQRKGREEKQRGVGGTKH